MDLGNYVRPDVVASTAEWLTAIGTIGATAVALGLGLGAREWIFRPRLRLSYSPENISNNVVTGTLGGGQAAYVRLLVENYGRAYAGRVRVSLIVVERWDPETGNWTRERAELDSATFMWSNRGGAETLDLPRKSRRPLDLFAIARDLPHQGQMPMELQLSVRPANRHDQLPPGAWRIKLEISGDNVAPTMAYIAFRFDGAWPGADPNDVWGAISVHPPRAMPPPKPPTPAVEGPAEQLQHALEADSEDERGL